MFTKTITVSFDCHFIYIFSFDIKIHLKIFFLQNVELKKTRDVSEVIFFSLMISISQILIHYICMYNGQRQQKEQKIKLQTPFKKSLILGMKNDVEKKNHSNTPLLFTFFPNNNHTQSSIMKKKFVNFCKDYIHIK